MRAFLAFGLAAVTMLAGSVARADDPKAAPSYGELPLVAVPASPEKPVRWVGGHEKTQGFLVRGMEGAGEGSAAAEIYASSADAKALRDEPNPALAGCFREQASFGLEGAWPWGAGEPRLAIWSNGEDAHLVHAERLVESDDHTKATLETTEAWVDARTRGAKQVSRASLALVRVGGVLDDVRVYAAREEGPSGKRVHVALTRKHLAAPSATPFLVDHHGRQSQGSCAHEHVVLRADTAAGDVAVVRTTMELPNNATPEGATPAAEDLIEMRLRDVEVQLGASQTSRDPQPVFTVSFGWAAREQRARVPGVFMGRPRAKMRKR